MNKQEYLEEIKKGCRKKDSSLGHLSFFSVDNKPAMLEANRYKHGFVVPHFTELVFVNEDDRKWLENIRDVVEYEYAALLFSETPFKKGVSPHIHVPYTDLPTMTFTRNFYQDKDDPYFNFYKKVEWQDNVAVDTKNLVDKKTFCTKEDAIFIFESCVTPHGVEVLSDSTSIVGFFFFEKVKNVEEVLERLGKPYHDMR